MFSDITINDEDIFTWTDSFAVPLSSDQEASVSSGRVPVVEIDLSADIHLKITRTKTEEGNYFLGIMIPHSEGLSGHTTGVMGKVLYEDNESDTVIILFFYLSLNYYVLLPCCQASGCHLLYFIVLQEAS